MSPENSDLFTNQIAWQQDSQRQQVGAQRCSTQLRTSHHSISHHPPRGLLDIAPISQTRD